MKRAFLLIVVSALLVALGFAQTPAASINTDQTTIKGCLGGSDGNYTVVEDNTGHTFKITTSSVDLKPHLGHDVTLIGHRASGVSSAAADSTFAVTELNMISEHCAAAAAAPAATVTTPAETAITPAAAVTPPAETAITPTAAATPPAETVVTPAAAATPPAETAVTPTAAATPPAETAITPIAAATPPAETVVTPAAAAAHPTRLPAHPRKLPATPAAATTLPAATASTSSEPVSTAAATTPAAIASTPSEPVSTPAAVATTPTATSKGWSLWLLIAFGVLVVVIGTMFPFLSRWRKRKSLERTGAPNLSFTREASSDQNKPDQPRKAA